MKKLYLHIGAEKTGTTTIQSFMAENRVVLRHEGFLYPLAPGEVNHVGLTILATDNRNHLPKRLLRTVGLAEATDVSGYLKQMLLDLKDEAQKSGCHTLVLSNEHLSSHIRARKSITKVRNTLLGIADAIEVIVYLRRQDEAVLSEYSTKVKTGHTERFALAPGHLIKYCYADLLDRWSEVFGREHISVRLFDRDAFEGSDLITDFLHFIHCPSSASFSRVPPRNISLDVVCLEYLRRLNRYLPADVNGRRNEARANIVGELEAISTGEKPRISSQEAAEILKQFEESNRDVAVRYLHRQNGQLFASAPERSVDNNMAVFDEDMAYKVSAALWRRMRGRILRR
jgi:hypothetical protein